MMPMTDRPYTGQPAESFNFQFIRYAKAGYRATITFNRPDVLNCVNGPMLREISAALRDVSYDDAIAVLVLTGAGERAFCTGADLKEQQQFLARPRDYYKWMADFIECHDRLRNLGKPTLARLNGIVVGGGNEFNMSCDLAIAPMIYTSAKSAPATAAWRRPAPRSSCPSSWAIGGRAKSCF
jgi:enoyl-CoA hydratase/carnithine racemase